jgi:hypothetical protein
MIVLNILPQIQMLPGMTQIDDRMLTSFWMKSELNSRLYDRTIKKSATCGDELEVRGHQETYINNVKSGMVFAFIDNTAIKHNI